MRSLLFLSVSLFLWTTTAPRVSAVQAIYTATGMASGSLNGSSFATTQVTFTYTGDTDFIQDLNPDSQRLQIGVTGTFSILGVGSGELGFSSIFVGRAFPIFILQASFAGMSADMLNLDGPALSTYFLDQPLGPIDLEASFSNGGGPFGTDAGPLIFDPLPANTTFSFQAVIVPEPGPSFLLGVAATGMALARRRRT